MGRSSSEQHANEEGGDMTPPSILEARCGSCATDTVASIAGHALTLRSCTRCGTDTVDQRDVPWRSIDYQIASAFYRSLTASAATV